jgi:hypothetical protein
VLGAEITSSGRAGVLWEVDGRREFAETTQAGTFLRPQRIRWGGYSAALNLVDGTFQVFLTAPEQTEGPTSNPLTSVFATKLPFKHRALVATLPSLKDIVDVGTVLVSDGHDELLVSTDWEPGEVRAAYRRAGHAFGPTRTIARMVPPESGGCVLSATMNSRGEALAAWACSPSYGQAGGPPEFGQAALFGHEGRLRALSPQLHVISGYPGVALDSQGRALAAWENTKARLMSLTGSRGRFAASTATLARGGCGPSCTVAIAPGAIGLASWPDRSPAGSPVFRVARIHLPR